jgi:hypothetical protein
VSRKPACLGGKAEGEGFEPSIRRTTDNGFRDRRIRPLCHPSGRTQGSGLIRVFEPACPSPTGLGSGWEAEKEGFEPSKEVSTPLTP